MSVNYTYINTFSCERCHLSHVKYFPAHTYISLYNNIAPFSFSITNEIQMPTKSYCTFRRKGFSFNNTLFNLKMFRLKIA